MKGKNSMGGGAPACGRYQVLCRRTLRYYRPRSGKYERVRVSQPRAEIRETPEEQRPREVRSHEVGETAACKKRPISRGTLQGRSKFTTGTNHLGGQGLLWRRSLRVRPARSGDGNHHSVAKENREEQITMQEQSGRRRYTIDLVVRLCRP
jgi:bisphosphoglycerate-dependent phosphoglycerate mutase